MFSNDWEIILLLVIALSFMGLLIWSIRSNRKTPQNTMPESSPPRKKNASVNSVKPKVSVFESYDYLGTKIYHNDGKYTVVEDGVSRNFSSLTSLPVKYQKMILEMETKNFSGKKNNYYMENKNGKYSIVFPDGTTKQYKNYNDIPENLRKILAG